MSTAQEEKKRVKKRLLDHYEQREPLAFLKLDGFVECPAGDPVVEPDEDGDCLFKSWTWELRSGIPVRLQVLDGTDKRDVVRVLRKMIDTDLAGEGVLSSDGQHVNHGDGPGCSFGRVDDRHKEGEHAEQAMCPRCGSHGTHSAWCHAVDGKAVIPGTDIPIDKLHLALWPTAVSLEPFLERYGIELASPYGARLTEMVLQQHTHEPALGKAFADLEEGTQLALIQEWCGLYDRMRRGVRDYSVPEVRDDVISF